ncbi:hypothetical protein Agabi119p4_11353 [Agaricus bisporus var. burnettii]|uniref:Uncharacterized protein n=1 Tax=Agaricus bisporus var. burnettii TaxID=192524 RepID=A0A8H7BYY2_AGABI|nr:hypothetical protein Agabi119p4_11353 [Agaricus bisporus var. burnettii]
MSSKIIPRLGTSFLEDNWEMRTTQTRQWRFFSAVNVPSTNSTGLTEVPSRPLGILDGWQFRLIRAS